MDYKYIYFVGIGGIGMSALARWFQANKFEVSGYDKTQTMLTQTLTQEGIKIHYEENIEAIPQNASPENTLVIYTPAVPAEHQELVFFRENHFTIQKRAEVLGMISQQSFTVAVAGTHGKTTTSSMIAHILTQAQKPCTAFLGGILQNYDSNLLLNPFPEQDEIIVAEADEYDRSFLHLSPNVAVITSMEADHLDIYGSSNEIEKSFVAFSQKINSNGFLFLKKDLNLPPKEDITTKTYALEDIEADFYARDIAVKNGYFYFDFVSPSQKIDNIQMQIQGFHNVENAIVASAVCENLGVEKELIKQGLESFWGAKRRFEYWIQSENLVLIDDYAHHPSEVKAFLESVKALYPQQKITAIFQPHLFTRTRDFMNDFAQSLSLADEVILLEIYPAREKPIENVNSAILLEKINLNKKYLFKKEYLCENLKKLNLEIVLTIGAGDIGEMLPEIKNTLKKI